ncbi:MAG: PIG-L family deacetylase, partial [Muribaculaceae bacterium]|nr:PIG-L family deacetylase [Muribaculaceae bacterium]
KIYTRIFETSDDGSEYLARHIADVIRRNVAAKNRCVMALGSGRSTHSVYASLIAMYERGEVSFDRVIVFTLSEFFPLIPDGPSTLAKLREIFLDKVNVRPANIHSINPAVTMENMFEYCKEYERQISDCGGIDLTVCEIGANGTLAFNEPGSLSTSRCRLVLLSPEARHSIQASYKCDECPTTAITLGLANILASTRVMCMAWGENSSKVVYEAIEGPVTDKIPASFLQLHNHARVALDLSAADDLTRISYPWKVTSCEWTNKQIRRAIVWLCGQTGKPILKLTNKDYTDWGLGELVALFGSAYNVNIKVFNELQHTITGWPGGKPNADDTSRPERATPYPKRVIVFSPHPDDDVISMGGTLKRLVDQGHDVHVAYETSGNIAVGDEDMMRYFMMMDKIAPMFGFDNEAFMKLSNEVREFVGSKKSSSDVDTPEVREIKTMIRQAEASIACNYIGVKPENVHFLRLPFYETGTIKKGDLSERDVDIVKNLLTRVKPHQIFVAGDLADPHGTHRVCT